MSCHSITRLQESHTVSLLRYLFSVYQTETMLGREGRPVQSKQGAGKRQMGTGPGGKGWSLSTHLKGSTLEQAQKSGL